jgi:hypothetical protein
MSIQAIKADCDAREATGVRDEQVRNILNSVVGTTDPCRKMYYILVALMTSSSMAAGVLFNADDKTDEDMALFLSRCCARFDNMVRGLTEKGSLCVTGADVCYIDIHQFVYDCLLDFWTV